MEKESNSFFKSYKGSFSILLSTILIGFIIEVFSNGNGLKPLSFPFNVIVLVELIILIPLAFFLYKKTSFIKWLSSVPAAIASIVAMTTLVLLIGFIPKGLINESYFLQRIGFGHFFNSWPYYIASLQLIIILGFTVVRRFLPFSFRNFAFFLNHFGLWLTLVAASLGSGDLVRLTMYCHLNETTSVSMDENHNRFKMPFSLTLHQFNIEEYNPSVVLIRNNTGEIIKGKNKSNLVEKGKDYNLNGWKIHVDKFIPYAVLQDSQFIAKDTTGAVAAALIKVQDRSQWISSGNFMHNPVIMPLDTFCSVALTISQPKKYKSQVTLTDNTGKQTFTLEVNKPFNYQGWKLYQTGFDEQKGKWSDLSIIEAVRDPWLKAVFAGIYILIGGAILMFWMGKRKKEEAGI